ncbi:minor tail protein [Salmonella phage 19]|nr:minor tail protein [Salmonella phage 19]
MVSAMFVVCWGVTDGYRIQVGPLTVRMYLCTGMIAAWVCISVRWW